MTLILAVNPGSTQNNTLSRLARELPNCELIGADSYNVAIKAIDQRAPDLVLLPGTDALAEAELLRRLRAVPRSVATLRLPPPLGLDVKALAADVRRLLRDPAGASLHIGASPHLLAAAEAAVDWVRARQSAWEAATGSAIECEPSPAAEVDPPAVPDDTDLVARLREAALHVELERERQRQLQADEPSALEKAAEAATELGETVTSWLPRLAVAAAVLIAAAAAVMYWPAIRGMPATTAGDLTATSGPAQQAHPEPAATPAANQAPPPPSSAPLSGAPAATEAPGWIAVFAPFEVSVAEGNDHVALDGAGRAMLPSGPHRLRFRNAELGYDEIRSVRLKPAETATVNLVPRTTLAVTSTEPAEVLVDGMSIGQAPVEKHRLDYGAHTVTVRAASQERQFNIEPTLKPIALTAVFAQP